MEKSVKKLEFNLIKDDLLKAVAERLTQDNLNPSEFTLIDKFINQPIQAELTSTIMIGGPTVPMIAVIKNTTGQLLFYALKALLPDLKI